jgi:hypothetical protein
MREARQSVSNSEVRGHVFLISNVTGDVTVVVGGVAGAAPAHRQRVLTFAPEALEGRDAELRELESFALGEGSES